MGVSDIITATTGGPFVLILSAVSLNILKMLLTTVERLANNEYEITMKEPFNQALPVLQQFHHILNEILFPGGVSVTFGNVMTMGVTLCGLACVISMGNAVHTITAELRKAQKGNTKK